VLLPLVLSGERRESGGRDDQAQQENCSVGMLTTALYLTLLHARAVGRKQEGGGRGAVETAVEAEAVVGTPWLGETKRTESEDKDSDEWGEDEGGLEERDDEASYCTH